MKTDTNTAPVAGNKLKSSPWLTLSVYLLIGLNSFDWLISVETLTPETEFNPIMAWIWANLGFAGFTITKLILANMAVIVIGLQDRIRTLWFLNAVYAVVVFSHVIGALNV